MRGIHDFVQKYDLQHPDNPIQQVNVGMGHNRLKPQCERFKSEDNLLHVPKSYGFADAKDEQRILYKRHERKKVLKGEREDENDIRPD